MKERLTNNLGLKILSILIAFFIWLLVVNVSNPEVSRSQEVTLEIENGSLLTDANKAYELNRRTVSVTYDIHTLDEYQIRASDFRAYVDLSELYDVTGSVVVKVEVLNNSNLIRNVAAKPTVVRVSTEELQSKEFDLAVNIDGRPMENYSVNQIVLEPSTITVEGPISEVGLINSVGVEIDVAQSGDDVSGIAEPVFYDANGNVLSSVSRVTMDSSEISYHVSINRIREIPVVFEPTGTAADGYRYTGYEASTDSVQVSGDNETLSSLTQITVQSDALNVDGASTSKSVAVNISDYLPEGIVLASQESGVIDVTLNVEALASKTIRLSESEIQLIGTEDTLTYRLHPTYVSVTIQGLASDVDNVRVEDLGITVDVSGMEEGTYDAELGYLGSEMYQVTQADTVQVEVSRRAVGPGISAPPEERTTEAEEAEEAVAQPRESSAEGETDEAESESAAETTAVHTEETTEAHTQAAAAAHTEASENNTGDSE